MLKRTISLVGVLLASLVLFACTPAPTPASASAPASAPEPAHALAQAFASDAVLDSAPTFTSALTSAPALYITHEGVRPFGTALPTDYKLSFELQTLEQTYPAYNFTVVEGINPLDLRVQPVIEARDEKGVLKIRFFGAKYVGLIEVFDSFATNTGMYTGQTFAQWEPLQESNYCFLGEGGFEGAVACAAEALGASRYIFTNPDGTHDYSAVPEDRQVLDKLVLSGFVWAYMH